MKTLVISGIFIHIIVLLSIFDIYFKSPVINNVAPCVTKGEHPATRLVLLVVDGLRMDALVKTKETALKDMETVAPYLR